MSLEEIREIAEKVCQRTIENAGKTTDPKTGQQLMEFWLPEELKELLVEEHDRPEDDKTGIAVVKYFGGPGTWWASELNPEYNVFYGKAEIHFKEYGTFSLEELRETRIPPFGLYIERDYYFRPSPLNEC